MSKILLIYQGHYPWDVRIEKFVETLMKDHIVHLITRNLKSSKSTEMVNDNFFIHRLQVPHSILSTPFHHNFIWNSYLEKKIHELGPSIIIVRDLPLAKLAIRKGDKHNIPVIFDNAENYPEFIRTFPKYQNFIFKLLNKIGYFEKLEKFCINRSYKTINVIEENTKRLSAIAPKDKMMEIYNVPLLRKTDDKLMIQNGTEINICYVGAVNDDKLRGVSDLILSSKFIHIPHKIHVFGDGNEKDNLMKLSKSEGLEQNIVFHGQINYSELDKYLYSMDIGVVTHRKNVMTNTTMANKIYEYISYGMCVVTSDATPLERFTKDNKIGLVYKSGDFKNLANKVIESKNNNLLCHEQRAYRMKLYRTRYNWDIEEKKLLHLLESIKL